MHPPVNLRNERHQSLKHSASENHVQRLHTLIRGALAPPPGKTRIALALAAGLAVHLVFALAVAAMIWAMFFGMSRSFGQVPWPYAFITNIFLVLQFPLVHSFLLTGRGIRLLGHLIPGPHAQTLGTTTYAIIASLQLLALFAFWTPSGIIWWQAEGWALYACSLAYSAAWIMLIKASWDAGAEVQSGALGWMSLLRNTAPRFPGMPTGGLFRVIRQPIYVAFALTLWTVPTWTPDQLVLAITLTIYCLAAPKLKEKRFEARYGERFRSYKREVPYALPGLGKGHSND